MLLWILASTVDATDALTLLANGWDTLFINGKSTFVNGSTSVPKNPPDCIVFYIWVSDNFILADKLFAKASRRFANLCLSW